MSTGLGTLAKVGINSCAWGASWVAVDELVPFTDESVSKVTELIENSVLQGKAGRAAPDLGLIKIEGNLKVDLDYYNCQTLLEMAFGTNTAGVFTMLDNQTKCFRMEIEKNVSRWRFNGCMVEQFVIAGEKGKVLTTEYGLVCCDLTRSATAFPSLSLTTPSRIRYSNSTSASRIRIADQADALAAEDQMGLESFKFTITRGLKKDDFTNEQRTALVPVINGFRTVKLEAKFNRYTVDTLLDWADAGTKLQSDFYFTDETKTFLLEIPEMKISDAKAPVAGAETVVHDVMFDCFRNISNTPMAAITDEARITIT
jgi:hypothetical protein